MKCTFLSLATFLVASVASAAPAFTTVDYPGTIGVTRLVGVNHFGQVLGSYTASDNKTHNFIYQIQNGTFTLIQDVPGAPLTSVTGLNDDGLVSGISQGGPNDSGFIYNLNTRVFSYVPRRFDRAVVVNGIGVDGTLCGYLNSTSNGILKQYGVVGLGYDFRLLDVVPANSNSSTNGLGISSANPSVTTRVVGIYFDAGRQHGFLWSISGFASLDFPQARFTSASGIYAGPTNASIQIVGSYGDSARVHGYLFSGLTTWTSFDAPDATISTFATSINDAGVIVGIFQNATGEHGFVRMP